MKVVALFDDLLLGSNVLGMLQAAGHDATLAGPDADLAGADVVIIDLGAGGFDGVELVERGATGNARTLGVYSHVDAETRRRAQDAGFDLVVPRSRMAREGAGLIEKLM